ncbi:glutamate ABC transporter substrate-binding protein [Kribbella sancticallisti]|uniref:Glutamate ABC transporter substrate-binding protein n=1 Tax=Kribbella sancticallisti TaxID=460087 RepID=A0ABN2EJA1_9ACTN
MKKKRLIAASLTLLFAATACGSTTYEATQIPVKQTPPVSTPAPPAKQDCTNPLQSYAPDPGPLSAPGAMPTGSTMAKIQAHGRLVAGISADSLNLGSRNPISGKIEGFDIDMIRAVAEAIFGDENKVELRVISSPQRLPVLKAPRTPGAVDIVARNMTINCARWKEIAFSAEYYRSGQKLLVRSDMKAETLAQLSGQKVCAPAGSTSLDNMIKANPKVVPVTADTDTGCLVLFQQGKVVAITGDDTVLAGEAAQDPYARITKAPAFSAEPYGLGMNPAQVDFVKFVNKVLEEMKADGRWKASYDKWLGPSLEVPAVPPAPVYGR